MGMGSPLADSDSSLKGKLVGILRDLSNVTQGVDGATLVRHDGLIVSTWTPNLSDDSIAAAMSAALLNIGANVVNQLKLGDLRRVVVSGRVGDIILTKAADELILSVITRKGTSLGMAFLELSRTRERIAEAMSERK
jgi:predicted regulator of Ras-like GTPase activity (Roadblock/LC7/MglB family)